MAKLWLPMTGLRAAPRPSSIVVRDEVTGRQQIVVIAGARHLDQSQYDYIVEGQTEKTKGELRKLGPKPVARMSKNEVQGALRDFLKWRNNRKADPGYKQVY